MRKLESFRQPIARPSAPPQEEMWWFWHPGRFGVRGADLEFTKRLHRVGEELEATWHPLKHRWLIWMRSPRVNHKICQGWKLLFINQEPDGSYLPLDERVFARLYAASVFEHGSAKEYFNRIQQEYERDKERREKQHYQDTIDLAMPSFDHSQIKVSGFGKSSGSKFSTYHA